MNYACFHIQLLGEERFRALDKIKTIGSTYMAAVGLIPDYKIVNDSEDGGMSAITYLAQVWWNIMPSVRFKPSKKNHPVTLDLAC